VNQPSQPLSQPWLSVAVTSRHTGAQRNRVAMRFVASWRLGPLALAPCHAEGRGFESHHPLHVKPPETGGFLVLRTGRLVQ
jgi:hypothetical protein